MSGSRAGGSAPGSGIGQKRSGNGLEATPDEPLGTLTGVDFCCVEITMRIDRYIMDPMELPGVAAVPPEVGEDFSRVAQQRPDVVVGSIGIEKEELPRIGG